MKINRQSIPDDKEIVIEDDVDFSSYSFDPLYCRGIPSCHFIGRARQYEDALRINASIKGEVIGVCAYSLEDVPLTFDIKEEIIFVNEEDGENYFEPDNIFDIDKYILALIFSSLPTKIIKEGKKPPKDGEGYRLISEEELMKEKENPDNSPFAVLDDLDL